MRQAIYQSYLFTALKHRNLSVVLNVVLFALIFSLIGVLVRVEGQTRTIVVPPVVHDSFWVDRTHVSPSYLAEMANFFLQLYLTVSPGSSAYQRDVLLRYTDPAYYGALSDSLIALSKKLRQNSISLVFYPVDTQVEEKKWLVRITGDLHTLAGNKRVQVVRQTYDVTFRYHQGRLLITNVHVNKES